MFCIGSLGGLEPQSIAGRRCNVAYGILALQASDAIGDKDSKVVALWDVAVIAVRDHTVVPPRHGIRSLGNK